MMASKQKASSINEESEVRKKKEFIKLKIEKCITKLSGAVHLPSLSCICMKNYYCEHFKTSNNIHHTKDKYWMPEIT
jgi:hypothetical protein